MKFTKLYEDVKASDLFKPFSPEKVAELKAAYPEVKLKERLDSVEKTKLVDSTWHIHGNLNISNYELTTLKSLNISITDGDFSCSRNKLTTLQGAPTTVNGSFYCHYNKLATLHGAPTTVNRHFSCSNNTLTSLEGAPKEVDGDFECQRNRKQFTEAEVREVCDVKGSIYI